MKYIPITFALVIIAAMPVFAQTADQALTLGGGDLWKFLVPALTSGPNAFQVCLGYEYAFNSAFSAKAGIRFVLYSIVGSYDFYFEPEFRWYFQGTAPVGLYLSFAPWFGIMVGNLGIYQYESAITVDAGWKIPLAAFFLEPYISYGYVWFLDQNDGGFTFNAGIYLGFLI